MFQIQTTVGVTNWKEFLKPDLSDIYKHFSTITITHIYHNTFHKSTSHWHK